MKTRTYIAIAAASLVIATSAMAAEITAPQVKACETELTAKNKADKAAAPEGFKPDHPRGYRQTFIAECLSKEVQAQAK